MENHFYKSTGWSLAIGSILAIVTMLLHPAGGEILDIITEAKPMQIAHTIAICCLPFMLFGFYGLTNLLSEKRKLGVLAFTIIAFGLIAAMLAALLNGLVLPQFLSQNKTSLENNEALLYLIMNYGFAINKALDYVFIVALAAGITLYSMLMITKASFFKLLGYFGLVLFFLSIVGLASNFAFTGLLGFRIFVFSMAGWIFLAGIGLISISRQ